MSCSHMTSTVPQAANIYINFQFMGKYPWKEIPNTPLTITLKMNLEEVTRAP